MEVIYLDSLFALNLLADYLMLLCAGRICSLVLRRKRYLLAALLGAIYAAAVYLPGLSFLRLPGWKLLIGAGMGWIAYGRERTPLRCIAVFFAVSAAFGGAIWALGGRFSLPALLGCFGGFFLLFSLLFSRKRRPEERLVRVRLGFLGRQTEFMVLRDSGNGLRDPVGGEPVLVACPHALAPAFGTLARLLEIPDPVALLEAARQTSLEGKLRLVPYAALGGEGLLPAFRPDFLELDGTPDPHTLVAVSPRACGEDFEGIL